MKYRNVGFRAFYHHFCCVPMSDDLKNLMIKQQWANAEEAQFVMIYGFIDDKDLMQLEVLSACLRNEKDALFILENPNNSYRITLNVDAIADQEAYYFEESENTKYREKYADKLKVLEDKVKESIEEARSLNFLDPLRDYSHPDVVQVRLNRIGCNEETCWAKITDISNHTFIGQLMSQPKQDFKIKVNEYIMFNAVKDKDNHIVLVSDRNDPKAITQEDLQDGKLLERYIELFNKERTEVNLYKVLQILRDSVIYVPCTAVFSDEDIKRMQDIIGENGEHVDDLVGKEFTTVNQTRLVPDILTSGDNKFFPIFSSEAAMGDYGKHFSKIPSHILDVIPLAKNNEQKPVGIVINAFTTSLVIPDTLYEVIQNMKSMIEN